jgi:hypothetical protein
VERDVALLVGQDPPRHIRSERVAGAIAQGPVITQRHHFRDHQHQQFHAQAHETPQAYENRVTPVAGQRPFAARGQEPSKETGVVLFFGDEEPNRLRVVGVTGLVRFVHEVGAVTVLADLKALDTGPHRWMQRRASTPVRVTMGAPALALLLEPPCPLGEVARMHPVSPSPGHGYRVPERDDAGGHRSVPLLPDAPKVTSARARTVRETAGHLVNSHFPSSPTRDGSQEP